jgi:hypothetical protein
MLYSHFAPRFLGTAFCGLWCFGLRVVFDSLEWLGLVFLRYPWFVVECFGCLGLSWMRLGVVEGLLVVSVS